VFEGRHQVHFVSIKDNITFQVGFKATAGWFYHEKLLNKS
jgi:hypothetical protein